MFDKLREFVYPRNAARYSDPPPGVGYTTALAQFQSWPLATANGGGTLTGHYNWRITQNPQVMVYHEPPQVGGVGTIAGQMVFQPLTDTRQTI